MPMGKVMRNGIRCFEVGCTDQAALSAFVGRMGVFAPYMDDRSIDTPSLLQAKQIRCKRDSP